MRVTNRHTAAVCGIAPGAEGEVREDSRGVEGLIKAGLLVPVVETPPPSLPAAGDAALRARFDAAWAERERAYAAELSAVRDAAKARAEALEAELAQLRAELEEATRPSPSAPDPSDTPSPPVVADPPKPARVRREG